MDGGRPISYNKKGLNLNPKPFNTGVTVADGFKEKETSLKNL